MKVIKRKIISIICIILLILQLTGCNLTNDEINWESKNQLIFGTTLSTKSLDPANGYSGWFLVRYGVGETLFKLDENMEVMPWLAEGYEQIDNNAWKIQIKDNIYFQNGRKLSAEAVKESLERTIKLNKRAAVTLKINSIKAQSNFIIITTSEENPTLINDLCDPFASIIDINSDDINSSPIGTGPFCVEDFNHSGSSYFKRNENYWDEEVKLDSIKVMPISDADTLAMALQSGEIDVAQGLPYVMVNLFKDDSNYKVTSIDTSRVIVMYFNEENKNLANLNVRKAINMLIDKEKYSSSILKGEGVPAIGAFPEENSIIATTYDVENAIELLKAEGYSDLNSDGILEKNGEKLSFKLVTYSSRAELTDIAQSIQNDLKNIGIEVSIEISDNITDILSSGKFDLCLYSNITSSTGDELAYLNNTIRTDGSSNYGNYSNEKADELINNLKVEFNLKKRAELSKEIQQIVLDEDGYNFIAHMKMSFVMKNNVAGMNPHPTDYYQFTANTDIE